MNHLGIDYGSKLAGTTVICFQRNDTIQCVQSEKKKDADRFIHNFINKWSPCSIYIDAPLSLPLAYFSNSETDYFYRKADRETKAMSPMFLGGLTARAMQLKQQVEADNYTCYEAYPKMLAQELRLTTHYKKDLPLFLEALKQQLPDLQLDQFSNWHQADALLAFICGIRHQNGQNLVFGSPDEGQIIV